MFNNSTPKIEIDKTDDALDKEKEPTDKIDYSSDEEKDLTDITTIENELPEEAIVLQELLRCVAYGQQDEAEKLLKQNMEHTQKLLTGSNFLFGDYSGRFFTCTAYEYAYWAKDTHMCRMLEQYMDDRTKNDLLQRVQRIEEPVGEGLFQAPKGLAYTQGGKKCHSAHFDLTPLKKALKTYVEAYNACLDAWDKTPSDLEFIGKDLHLLWLKVGLLQRDVPAHIAQEYCHPHRSFHTISKDPSILNTESTSDLIFERQLTFRPQHDMTDSSWFSPEHNAPNSELGVSFAVSRSSTPTAEAKIVKHIAFLPNLSMVAVDSAAIEAIDHARTNDLKQSFANLSAFSGLKKIGL